jgi:hypothetical protein
MATFVKWIVFFMDYISPQFKILKIKSTSISANKTHVNVLASRKNLIKIPIFLKNHVFWTQFKGKVKIPTGTFS